MTSSFLVEPVERRPKVEVIFPRKEVYTVRLAGAGGSLDTCELLDLL